MKALNLSYVIFSNCIIIISQQPMSEPQRPKDKPVSQARQDRLKEIEALYRSQIKQIYSEGKDPKPTDERKPIESLLSKQTENPNPNPNDTLPRQNTGIHSPGRTSRVVVPKSSSFLPAEGVAGSRLVGGDEMVRGSVLLRGESTRTIEILRRENETKQLKIRELGNRCEALVSKLKKYVEPGELEAELESLREYSQDKAERLENLFKIKNEEIFFKLKLQVIGLLQEFGLGKEQLADINEISNETALFTYLSRKLKGRLKDFRSRQQESTFELQKDRILNQKHQERIHYLTETNELLRLSQGKLKAKVEDLKTQLNDYLDRLKLRQAQTEERESQIFRLRKQNQELMAVNQKLSMAVKGATGEKADQRRLWEAKEKEMKLLLNNYLLEKKKLEDQLEEKEGWAEEVLIKQRFLEQENERLNRELVRWKERYQWQQKEKESRIRDMEEQRNALAVEFDQYKLQHNQGITLSHRSDLDEALRKVEEYQTAYQVVLQELEEQRRLLQRSEEQAEERLEKMESEWMDRVKRLEKMKEEEIFDLCSDNESRQNQLREQFQQKERLLAEEMQARMKALLAERDKKTTEQHIALSNENDELHKEIENLHKLLEVKESLISVIQSKNNWNPPEK